MIVVQQLQKLVDFRFGVVPVRFEAAPDVLEDHAPLTSARRQMCQPSILNEVAEDALLLVRRIGQLALASRALPRRGPETSPAETRRGSAVWTAATSTPAASAAPSTVRAPRAIAANTRRRCSSASRPTNVGDVVIGVEDACGMREACQNR